MIKKIAIFARTLNEEAISMEQNLTFADLGLSEEILQALEKKGYGYPTRIQAEAIPEFMQWKDVIAKAPTGTGKTFGQLTQEEKSAVSHRGRALKDFAGKLEAYLKK